MTGFYNTALNLSAISGGFVNRLPDTSNSLTSLVPGPWAFTARE